MTEPIALVAKKFNVDLNELKCFIDRIIVETIGYKGFNKYEYVYNNKNFMVGMRYYTSDHWGGPCRNCGYDDGTCYKCAVGEGDCVVTSETEGKDDTSSEGESNT